MSFQCFRVKRRRAGRTEIARWHDLLLALTELLSSAQLGSQAHWLERVRLLERKQR